MARGEQVHRRVVNLALQSVEVLLFQVQPVAAGILPVEDILSLLTQAVPVMPQYLFDDPFLPPFFLARGGDEGEPLERASLDARRRVRLAL